MKSKDQHTGTQHSLLCYRPAVFLRYFRLNALSFPPKKLGVALKNVTI